jgi:hypothetical protein
VTMNDKMRFEPPHCGDLYCEVCPPRCRWLRVLLGWALYLSVCLAGDFMVVRWDRSEPPRMHCRARYLDTTTSPSPQDCGPAVVSRYPP